MCLRLGLKQAINKDKNLWKGTRPPLNGKFPILQPDSEATAGAGSILGVHG